MTDKELYEKLLRRDHSAFRYVYDEYRMPVVSYVLKNSGTESDALDIFQEGVTALWVNMKKERYTVNTNTKLSTYLFSICRNLWLKRLRDDKLRMQSVVGMEVLPDEPEELDLSNYDRIAELEVKFNSLGEKCRRILHLFYYQKASIRDIAEQLDYTEASAKNEKYRCLRALRDMYS